VSHVVCRVLDMLYRRGSISFQCTDRNLLKFELGYLLLHVLPITTRTFATTVYADKFKLDEVKEGAGHIPKIFYVTSGHGFCLLHEGKRSSFEAAHSYVNFPLSCGQD